MALDSLEGVLAQIHYHQPPKWDATGLKFMIGSLSVKKDSRFPDRPASFGIITKVKGEIEHPVTGENYRLTGEWVDDPKYGKQFAFKMHEVITEVSINGMMKYLSTYVPSLGTVKSRALVDLFGTETINVLRTAPDRVRECEKISERDATLIATHFNSVLAFDPAAYSELAGIFDGIKGIRKNLPVLLLKTYKSDAPIMVKKNPYLLLAFPGCGWKTVDDIAMTRLGYSPNGMERQTAAIVESLNQLSSEGHTYGTTADVNSICKSLIGYWPNKIAWHAAVGEGKVRNKEYDDMVDLAKQDGQNEFAASIDPKSIDFYEDSVFALPEIAEAERGFAKNLVRLIRTAPPFPEIDTEGLKEGQCAAVEIIGRHGVAILTGCPGTGKAQPLDAKILTPTGWSTMGQMTIGSAIIGADGKTHRVTAVHPRGELPVFRVTFSDDASTECCGDHLWRVEDRRSRTWKTVCTDFIRENLMSTEDRPRWTIPMISSAEFATSDLPVEPYSMGLLLGNGCFRVRDAVGFTSADEQVIEHLRTHIPPGDFLVKNNNDDMSYRITAPNSSGSSKTIDALRSFDLHGKYSTEKWIPDEYLFSSVENRLSIMQGLLDTDGYTDGHHIEYSTSSPHLAKDFQFLVESLGGHVSISTRIPVFTHKGEKKKGAESFRVFVMLPQDILPFRLARKAARFIPKTKYQPRRRIVSVDPIGFKECQCITVDAPDHLYVTDHFVVTHNSHTVASVINALLQRNEDGTGNFHIRVACPTGKAAKTVEEMLYRFGIPSNAVPCSTIHRLLLPTPSQEAPGPGEADAKKNRGRLGFKFGRNQLNPIDANVIILDESSMTDIRLGNSLLAAIKSGTRVIFVGDQNQLPSIGPGSVLRDMLKANIPTASLTEIVRSDGGGTVVQACHAIKDGRTPKPAEKPCLPLDNWIHYEYDGDDTDGMIQKIIDIHARPPKSFPDAKWDIQVISPQKERPANIACNDLNWELSLLLNPHPDPNYSPTEQDRKFEPRPRVGDKVIRTKNGCCDELKPVGEVDFAESTWRWQGKTWAIEETDIVNGDMGEVVDIIKDEGADPYILVKFRVPEKLCRLPLGEDHLSLAYAITVHKAQGSSCPMVIMPVHPGFHWNPQSYSGIWCRELFYTGLSRTSGLLVTIGPFSAIPLAVSRQTIQVRRTKLVDYINEAFHDWDWVHEGEGSEIVEEVEVKADVEIPGPKKLTAMPSGSAAIFQTPKAAPGTPATTGSCDSKDWTVPESESESEEEFTFPAIDQIMSSIVGGSKNGEAIHEPENNVHAGVSSGEGEYIFNPDDI